MLTVEKLLAEAVEDPGLMAALLEKGGSPKKRRAAERQINAWLLQQLPEAVSGDEAEAAGEE